MLILAAIRARHQAGVRDELIPSDLCGRRRTAAPHQGARAMRTSARFLIRALVAALLAGGLLSAAIPSASAEPVPRVSVDEFGEG